MLVLSFRISSPTLNTILLLLHLWLAKVVNQKYFFEFLEFASTLMCHLNCLMMDFNLFSVTFGRMPLSRIHFDSPLWEEIHSQIWTKTIILHDTKYNVIGILHQRNAYDLNLNLNAYRFSFSEWNHPPLNFVYCERRTKATETTWQTTV